MYVWFLIRYVQPPELVSFPGNPAQYELFVLHVPNKQILLNQ